MRIKLNPNQGIVNAINKKLKENQTKYGKAYCPCMIIQDDSTVCLCEEFRTNEYMVECHCGKYIRVESKVV